jgi:hypothetical protein
LVGWKNAYLPQYERLGAVQQPVNLVWFETRLVSTGKMALFRNNKRRDCKTAQVPGRLLAPLGNMHTSALVSVEPCRKIDKIRLVAKTFGGMSRRVGAWWGYVTADLR